MENAKKACKTGYSVFDANGNVVFSNGKSYAKGAKVTLKNTALYASAAAKTGVKRSGTYYLYDGIVGYGRLRVTSKPELCGYTPFGMYVTGWVNKSDI